MLDVMLSRKLACGGSVRREICFFNRFLRAGTRGRILCFQYLANSFSATVPRAERWRDQLVSQQSVCMVRADCSAQDGSVGSLRSLGDGDSDCIPAGVAHPTAARSR